METLHREMEKLQAQMNSIKNAIEQLTALYSPLQSSIVAFSKKLSELFSFITSTKSTTTDSKDRLRKRQVFLRHFAHSDDDCLSLNNLCKEIGSPFPPTTFFRLKGDGGIRPLILTFPTAHNAVSFLRSLSLEKKEGKHTSLIARPNYTPEEEKIYHDAWAEACAKNDDTGSRLFVVRNLEVVSADWPGAWTRRVRPTRALV